MGVERASVVEALLTVNAPLYEALGMDFTSPSCLALHSSYRDTVRAAHGARDTPSPASILSSGSHLAIRFAGGFQAIFGVQPASMSKNSPIKYFFMVGSES